MGSQPDHHPGVLDGLVPIIKLGPHRAHIGPLGVHQQLLHPVHGNDFRVVVQQKHIFPGGILDPQIVHCGIIEHALISHDAYFPVFAAQNSAV